ncbi:MAG: hypothetical protein HY675_13555 [Chloroflexi bacterium]|nr:hypothetical protein [Chloroflexota bacterium]
MGKYLGNAGVAALKQPHQAANWQHRLPSGLKRSLQGRDAYPTAAPAYGVHPKAFGMS